MVGISDATLNSDELTSHVRYRESARNRHGSRKALRRSASLALGAVIRTVVPSLGSVVSHIVSRRNLSRPVFHACSATMRNPCLSRWTRRRAPASSRAKCVGSLFKRALTVSPQIAEAVR